MGQQVPSRPGKAHDTHAPVQATLQHKPSAQNPLAQSPAWVQRTPGAGALQLPARQARPPVQSSSLAQWSRQAPATGSQV